ncbi:AcrR family transcriptional regulator [Lachnospiraceae bacterium PF1-21]|uniref:TetR/AcrR family transcriptional regulator n=1 Tax=Ohessyouella blattaphilus TaxID=2949333 RepID=UPI003E2E5CC3
MRTEKHIKDLSRKEYVEKAHEILEKEGAEAISIRRLAKELGCSSTSLYRHFSNLEELLFFAQLGYLQDYLEDLRGHEGAWNNVWESHIGVWECFSRQAFTTPEAFDCIFFGAQSKHLPEALREYYEMFPEELQILSGYLQYMLQEGDFVKRDFYMSLRCLEAGVITLDNAIRMNHMSVYCFKGIFKGVLEQREKGEKKKIDVEQLVTEVVDCITDIVCMYAKDPLNIKRSK